MTARLWWSGPHFGWLDRERPGFRLVQLAPPEPLPHRRYPNAANQGVPLPYPCGPRATIRDVLGVVMAGWPDHVQCQLRRLLDLPSPPQGSAPGITWGDRRVMMVAGGTDHLIDSVVRRLVGRELQPWTACGTAELAARIDRDLTRPPPGSRARHNQLANLWLGYVDEEGVPYRPPPERASEHAVVHGSTADPAAALNQELGT